MTPTETPETKRNNAIFVYVVLILALQVYLLVVALEAFQADEETLAWPAAALSVGLFATTLLFARLVRHD
jgi:uncharacterized membrane protein